MSVTSDDHLSGYVGSHFRYKITKKKKGSYLLIGYTGAGGVFHRKLYKTAAAAMSSSNKIERGRRSEGLDERPFKVTHVRIPMSR